MLIKEVKMFTTTHYFVDTTLAEMIVRSNSGEFNAKILAIKMVRRMTGMGLARAKALVEVILFGESCTPSYSGSVLEIDGGGWLIQLVGGNELNEVSDEPQSPS